MDAEAKKLARRKNLERTEQIQEIPRACSNELAAVEFVEKQRWGDTPACVHCGDVEVYKMTDRETGERNKRFLWKCKAKGCAKQFTVRVGTVFEDSRLPLTCWVFAFWRASTSKKGVSAMEIMRQCQISYKSALFLMNRIRFAMTPDAAEPAAPLSGIVEADETYVGGKPRYKGKSKRGRGTPKTPVFAVVQRGGNVRARVVADVTGDTLKGAIKEFVDVNARVMTDENKSYHGLAPTFASHETVKHSAKEYARGDVNTNSIEGFFGLLKRSITGIYHNVSKEHLDRYVTEAAYRFNRRDMNDGERVTDLIQKSEGKRMKYKA